MNGGGPPLTYKRFQRIIQALDMPDNPKESVGDNQLSKFKTPIEENHDEQYGVPTLEELGL